jgi:hypothetical protein
MSRDFTLDKQAKLLRDSEAMKITIRLVLLLTFVYFASGSEETQAVLPPPDGGYPQFNTAEGQNALFSLTTGCGGTGI